MRTYTIAPTPQISFKAAASVFIGAFGTIWLFLEPLGLFGLVLPVGGIAGIASYLLMLCAALFVVVVFVRGYRWYKIHNLPYVMLNVASASDGVTYLLRVSANMQVGNFLHDFLDLISRGPGRERIQLFRRQYYPVLQVRRNDTFIDVDSNLTITTAKLTDQDFCQVRGEPYEHFDEILFSRAPAHIQPNES